MSASTPAVVVQSLGYCYAGRSEASLRDISFGIPAGSWTALVGHTAAGKSTLLRALAGLIPHHAAGTMTGDVLLFGQNTRILTTAALARTVGLVLQSPDDQICTTTVEAEVAFGLENLAVPSAEIGRRIAESLAQAGLTDAASRRTHALSGGQKQRLMLASILAMQPRLLLLDEPLSQLDPQASADLLDRLDALRASGLTIIMAEHRLDDVLPRADRVLILDQGRLAADLPRAADRQLVAALQTHQLEPPEVTQLALAAGYGPLFTAEKVVSAARAAQDVSEAKQEGETKRRGEAPAEPNPHATPNPARPEPRPPGERLLAVENLGFRYPGAHQPVWEGITFALARGERIALVGGNGSGKSTLLAALAGLLVPTEGKIQRRPVDCDQEIGLVLQNPDLMLFCSSVEAELAFGLRQKKRDPIETIARVNEAAEAFSLHELLGDAPLALSQGQRLRTAVAATIALEPNALLLDEPTTGQDQVQVTRVMNCLTAWVGSRFGCLLFSTHDVRTVVRYADRVLVLGAGRMLADCTPTDLLADESLLRAANLRRPPLFEVRHQLGLRGLNVGEMARELRR